MKTHIMRWCPQDWRTSKVRSRGARRHDLGLRLVYLELLFALHEAGGALPDDRDVLEDELALPWDTIGPALETLVAMGKLSRDGGRVVESRVAREVAEEQAFRQEQAERGRRGARAKARALAIKKCSDGQEDAEQSPEFHQARQRLTPAPAPAPAPAPGSNGALTPAQREEYAREVWAGLVARRGSEQPSMSSTEWHVLTRWMDERLPLAIVLRGIQDCGGTPKSLAYVAPAVQEAVERWRRSMVL